MPHTICSLPPMKAFVFCVQLLIDRPPSTAVIFSASNSHAFPAQRTDQPMDFIAHSLRSQSFLFTLIVEIVCLVAAKVAGFVGLVHVVVVAAAAVHLRPFAIGEWGAFSLRTRIYWCRRRIWNQTKGRARLFYLRKRSGIWALCCMLSWRNHVFVSVSRLKSMLCRHIEPKYLHFCLQNFCLKAFVCICPEKSSNTPNFWILLHFYTTLFWHLSKNGNFKKKGQNI